MSPPTPLHQEDHVADVRALAAGAAGLPVSSTPGGGEGRRTPRPAAGVERRRLRSCGGGEGEKQRGFPNPLEVAVPPGCEGWEELYPAYVRFGEDRRAFEESRFWFQDALHAPEPYYPFDAMVSSRRLPR